MALTDENNMVMPVAPMYGGGNGGFGGFGNDWGWIILLLLFAGGGWGNGFGGGYGFNNDFAWLYNGQQGINANTNAGFRDAMLNDGITSIRSGISDISTQLCNGFGNTQMALANGFAGIEASANARQMADMQTAFNLQSQLSQCCCDNRLATCQTQNIVQNEGNSTRFADANNTRDIIDSQTRGTQAILDKLCSLELDAKNDTIAQLRSELQYARGQASQDVQTAAILAGQSNEIDGVYNRLKSCPVGTYAVANPNIYPNQGCGCGM